METKQEDEQQHLHDHDHDHDMHQNTVIIDSVAAAISRNRSIIAPEPEIVQTTHVDTAGLNSLSEAAVVKGIDTAATTTTTTTTVTTAADAAAAAAITTADIGTTFTSIKTDEDASSPNDESIKIPLEQIEDALRQSAQAAQNVHDEMITAEEEPKDDGDKMDMVLTKLDDILARLDRIESLAVGGSLAAKSAARLVKPRFKNTSVSMMKTVQGNPIQEVNLHFYDNEYHVLPQGWVLPRLSFEGLMQYWYLGDPSAGVPPLIKVGGTEFKNLPRGVRKRSDMKYLMKHVERKGKELGCYVENICDWNSDAVRNIFARTREFFEYPNKSSAQTKFDKLSWETVCHNLRRNKGMLVGEDPIIHVLDELKMESPIAIPGVAVAVGITETIVAPPPVPTEIPTIVPPPAPMPAPENNIPLETRVVVENTDVVMNHAIATSPEKHLEADTANV